ncbi:YidH family protein [Pseudomonas urmiensis]|uniref:YidH family protein n=1 Tax=Pseudomonas urmiensis TaxID=2745493 RepID=UPI003CA31D7A
MNPEHRHTPWERWLLGQGKAPDPRFTLANERTFLAWIRTALALLGGAIALETFAAHAWPAPARVAMELALLAMSLLVSLGAGWRWLAVERALRREAPLPLARLVPLLSVACGLACLLLVGVFWERWHG